MRLALISDIHSNIAALDAVLADIQRRGVERIVNLGDSLSGPFAPRETAERLIALEIPTISGNHDRQLVDRPATEMGLWEQWAIVDLTAEQLAWVEGLPKAISKGGCLFCHATPDNDAENGLDYRGKNDRLWQRDLKGVVERFATTGASLIACGHTHTPRVVRIPSGPLVVNPGSVGCPAYLDTRVEPNFIQQTGAPDARYAIIEETSAGWTVALITLPYDSREMAELARQRGAESWVQAVETGWFA